MSVVGDDNGVLETCDDVEAHCTECDWSDDGSGGNVLEAAQEHANETRHSVAVSGTYVGSVEPD